MNLDALRMFVKVAELASFTRAAEHLGLSKARVSGGVRDLEALLGTRLLQRSTRAVRLTPSGEELLGRARQLVAEADELAAMFQAPSMLRGRVRVDMPQSLARSLFIPRLPELLAAHPNLEVQLSTTDRRVDVVREGFDCVLRVGKLDASGLLARRLGEMPMMNCASPGYLRRYGTPRSLEDLDGHLLVHYASRFGDGAPGFEYRDGDAYRERPMRAVVTVNSSDSFHAACLAGLGIIQAPRAGLLPSVTAGDLVEILPQHTCEPLPVSLVHPHGRNAPRPVRLVMGWITELIKAQLG
ncbi:LysR family transcriptional regulator [Anaeromyxobacter sp. PSR-1]|uniref:LysR family transcriptional regulator n=1 Tax=Anaeromyxobacter sp. PSR-1 TaxID=1300915 RepID=UPI0005E8D05A|nr:LysR family transcriptional regulator [Anaeromyxobacter sp. PSR-1]GAO01732.1 putative HTH-type transcriptional regulator YhjC [Anaeromyxobacter sp. PSR-1]